ncbi:hypothetical protein E2C01_012786 [Portunus trituberculatus]|uniref:Uncharacterized protein n=1 Tax=Portunus trituberculatus TaxID=210409 RepID=A0A5B7DF19_PORTR|nr:hypothetical protein [Portunus trituberculatus]
MKALETLNKTISTSNEYQHEIGSSDTRGPSSLQPLRPSTVRACRGRPPKLATVLVLFPSPAINSCLSNARGITRHYRILIPLVTVLSD